jgi:hypothetical protein
MLMLSGCIIFIVVAHIGGCGVLLIVATRHCPNMSSFSSSSYGLGGCHCGSSFCDLLVACKKRMHLEAPFRVELGQIWELLQGVHLRTV